MVKPYQHLLDTEFLSKEEMQSLLSRARFFEEHHEESTKMFQNRFVANLFFEPSTRTRFSFEVAEKRLGLNVLHFSEEVSSTTKGESMYDTVKLLSSIGVETVVIRHRDERVITELAKQDTGCTFINAGAGSWAHPTQALLDLYTIWGHFGDEIKGLRVAIIGDLKHSRVVRSNIWSLQKFGAEVVVSGPPMMRDAEIEKRVRYVDFEEAIRSSDVVMLLRVQLERHEQKVFEGAEAYLQSYGMSQERFAQMKSHAILMHPAPMNRGVEIADEVVEYPRSKIFTQMCNGVWTRMAVLERAYLGRGGH
ncbi:aspartate carbamoyltransferase catalytic subunit [Thermoactinomyces sp. DSM 45892]|uniref:aspartate carbamoyltransferase catalytic subunit n=1 Tax=Thermoactinomyces sp. DSM 45892 TaxID=1882753 RepID=UPI00089B1544|nr:aspartate carbamoyltransferase catalytic subunit [Thermoactinomyces sp. DSM 45892]SDY59179.1 aspartate carbamoyltransferase [Thermoactinomyces sp. DSM 45892]